MSQISIPNYPSSNLVPGVYLTVDASQANTDAVPQRALIIGQQLSNAPSLGGQPNGSTLSFTLGSYAPNVPALAGSVADVQQMAGHGSQLALMYAAYRKLDPSGEVWLLPLDDDPSAVLAAGSITIAGTATQAGVLSFYIAGQLVPVRVSVGDTREILGNNILAAINASRDLPCFAAALTDDTDTSVFTVQLQALNLGAIANDINLRLNYQGASGGEQTPAGLTMGFAAFSGGVQNPTALAAALANLSSQPYDYICCPYNDTTSLNTIESFLNDQTGRWSFDEQLFGHAFFAYRGTIGQRATFFATRDDQHTSGIGFYDSPSPPPQRFRWIRIRRSRLRISSCRFWHRPRPTRIRSANATRC
jgi:phage tail sheath gpL-like